MVRLSMMRGGLSWIKAAVSVVLLTVFINEVLVYYIQSWRWPTLPNIDRESGKHQVVLLVADPQIQGYQDEPIFPIGTLSRWDIDRYLWKTFSYAYEYSRPDVIVFLGDLFDEGSKASTAEYAQTLARFKAIFYPVSHIKTIYIPGDNDIGGEGRDFQTSRKVARYQQHFGNITDIHKFGFIDYIQLDIVTYAMSEDKIEAAKEIRLRQTSPFTVLVNHNAFMATAKHFVLPIIKRIHPQLVFSAHYHTAGVMTCEDCLRDDEYSWSVSRQELTYIDSYLTFDLSRPYAMVELEVPTCSYRMGVPNMGYGVAVIGEDGKVEVTFLWLPRRYTMLLSYLIVLVVIATVRCLMYYSDRRTYR